MTALWEQASGFCFEFMWHLLHLVQIKIFTCSFQLGSLLRLWDGSQIPHQGFIKPGQPFFFKHEVIYRWLGLVSQI